MHVILTSAVKYLELLEFSANAPAFVIGERVPILLKERVDARNAAIPAILEILQCQAPVLRIRLLTLQRVLGPDTLRVDELSFPRL